MPTCYLCKDQYNFHNQSPLCPHYPRKELDMPCLCRTTGDIQQKCRACGCQHLEASEPKPRSITNCDVGYAGFPEKPAGKLPTDAKARKDQPIARGLLDYFPLACAAVAELSRIGNEQHNPGQPMHWVREKSTDHADCIVRHLIDRGTVDTDGVRHATKVAWRALALLQTELEDAACNRS